MTGARLDSMPGFELQQHGSRGLQCAGVGDLSQQPLKHAFGAVGWRKVAGQLTSEQKHGLVRVHGDHAHVSWRPALSGNSDICVQELLAVRRAFDHDHYLQREQAVSAPANV